jgi:hypothetical protein
MKLAVEKIGDPQLGQMRCSPQPVFAKTQVQRSGYGSQPSGICRPRVPNQKEIGSGFEINTPALVD